MEKTSNNGVACVIKGVLTAVITALIGVLVFALVIKITVLSSNAVKTVNQFIKILAVFLGCVVAVRAEKGLIKGALIGVISNFTIYLVFSTLGGVSIFTLSFLIDTIFLLIVGGITGVIAVNLKK